MYIKRPFVVFAMVYIVGTICAMAANWFFTTSVGLFLLSSIAVWMVRNKASFAYIFLFFLFILSYGVTFRQIQPKQPLIFSQVKDTGIKVSVLGTIKSIEPKDSYFQILIQQSTVKLKNYNSEENNPIFSATGILVYTDSLPKNENGLLPGDRILIEGSLKEFDTARNQGNFDSREFYKAYKINYRCNADNITLIKHSSNQVSQFVYHLKNNLKRTYDTLADEKDSALFTSIVLGDRTELKEEVSNLYRDSGIAHLLAVSGLNFSMLGFGIYKIIRKAGISFLTSTIISSSIMILYGLMAGDGASVIRALIMFIIAISAGIFGRTYDVQTAAAIAAIMMVSDSPYMLLNSGFLLSFGAVIGIIYISPVINKVFLSQWEEYNSLQPSNSKTKYIRRICSYFFYSITLSISVDLVTFPIILYFFYQYPLYSIIINLILVPLMTIVMISAVISGLCGMLWLNGGIFLIGISHYILLFYDFICLSFLKFPHSLLTIGKPTSLQLILYYMLLIISLCLVHLYLFYNRKNKKRSRFPGILIITILPILIFIISFKNYEKLEITMLDIGQGESIFVKAPGNQTFLIDAGSSDIKKVAKYRIVPWLKASGRDRIDYVIISHMDSDHTNGILEILQNENAYRIHIRNIVIADIAAKSEKYVSFVNEISKYTSNIIYMKKGSTLENQGLKLISLHPSYDYMGESENDSSIVLSMQYKNFDMLFTGDITSGIEAQLLKEKSLHSYDILKVAHHGSRFSTSTELLKTLNPRYAIISSGVNNSYGHPHKELLERLNQANTYILNTSQTGEISIYTDGNKMYIKNFLKTNP